MTTAQSVWWDNNQPISRQHFETLKVDFLAHARLKSLFVQDLEAGADPTHMLPTRVITEQAWHALFMRHLLKPANDEDFEAALTSQADVSFAAYVTGGFDYAILLDCAGPEALDGFTRWCKAHGAARTESRVVLRRVLG